jgi:hypothetical protein
MGKTTKMKVEPGDKVYLKGNFRDIFKKNNGVRFMPEMDRFRGQQVMILAINLVYTTGESPKPTIICRMICAGQCDIRIPLECIDRSKGLVRNGTRMTMINKELYINIPKD